MICSARLERLHTSSARRVIQSKVKVCRVHDIGRGTLAGLVLSTPLQHQVECLA
jgi:hypothetical protein